jgi:hypothetical protein
MKFSIINNTQHNHINISLSMIGTYIMLLVDILTLIMLDIAFFIAVLSVILLTVMVHLDLLVGQEWKRMTVTNALA